MYTSMFNSRRFHSAVSSFNLILAANTWVGEFLTKLQVADSTYCYAA